MKRWMCFICLLALLFSLSACGAEHDSNNLSSEDVVTQNTQTDVTNKDAESEMQPDYAGEQGENGMNDFVMKIGDREIAVSWEDNESVSALMDLAKASPLQIELSMYGGFEQVGAIGSSLPKNDVQLVTKAGDIVLYSGNQIVVFYGSNSWSYTRLGRIEGMTQQELTELLGNGDVVLSLFFRDSNGEKTDAYPIEDITLNSGYTMPVIGLGTWTLSNEEAENSVYHALKSGMRLIDTARYYRCEVGVGRGIQRAINEGIVSRDEIFVTSKVMPSDYDRAAQGIDDSLSDLNLSYVDLMLIHQPGSNDEEVYKAMEQAVRDGKVRSIGISNYYTKAQVDEVLSYAEIVPAVIQNENHLYYQNSELQEYVSQYGIVIESWYPFGGRGHTEEHFSDGTIVNIAEKYGKTPAQVILRWQVQAGYIAIPGSSNPDHIAENYDIFNFELTEDEMQQIYNLDRQKRYENW
ncbi:aldo/keto reductase [Roseburia hominis]